MTPAAPPITATCRYCGAVIAWDDLFGWLKAGHTPNAISGQCSIGSSLFPPMGSGAHVPKEDS